MYSVQEIIDFLREETGNDEIYPGSDICDGIGITGDDFHELIEKFSSKFNIDLTGYLWYFHTEDEGLFSFGALFFDPPFNRVKRIPIFVTDLLEFANKGKWDIKYPEHQLPKRRYDLLINIGISGIILIFILVYLITKFIY